MASCPVCTSRLPAERVSSEFACHSCGARLRCNPYSAGLQALILGAASGGILLSVDESWPWLTGAIVASIVVACASWRVLFEIEPRSPPEEATPDGRTSRTAPAPWHLWVVGVVAFLWSGVGAAVHVMSQTADETFLNGFHPEQLAYFQGIPSWVLAAWAFGVWGGVLGAVLLLVRWRIAAWVLLASLLGLAVTTLHNGLAGNGTDVMDDPSSLGLPAATLLFALALFLYARALSRRGVLA